MLSVGLEKRAILYLDVSAVDKIQGRVVEQAVLDCDSSRPVELDCRVVEGSIGKCNVVLIIECIGHVFCFLCEIGIALL